MLNVGLLLWTAPSIYFNTGKTDCWSVKEQECDKCHSQTKSNLTYFTNIARSNVAVLFQKLNQCLDEARRGKVIGPKSYATHVFFKAH